MLIVAFFVLWIGGIGARLVYLQINQHDELRGKALNQRRDTVREKQLRGTIYDRAEHALAMSVNVKSLVADPSKIENIEAAAQEIAKVLNVKTEIIFKPLKEAKENNKRFVYLARKLDDAAVQKINEALEVKNLKKNDLPHFPGLAWREEQKRSYPYGTLAAQIIGFSNSEDIGSAGIEQSQEDLLHGAATKSWQDRDRLGRIYNEENTEKREPVKDIVLTISSSLQYKTEQALEKGVKASRAKSGIAIVMNPQTGEILAMANYPTFDPNKYTEYAAENYTNRAVQNMYAPGSIFKIVTFGGALQENLIRADGEINCGNGIVKMPGREIVDKHCHQKISYTDALAVSSNYATIKTAQQLGNERFFDYSQKFGFGAATGIELPAEARGQMRSPASWNADSLASMSIGYEINITALQGISAYAAIANNGIRVQPHIIKEVRQEGKVVSTTEAEKTQVMSAEAAQNLRRMLEKVVLSGTAKRAQLNGYTSAGKTGTAWKYDAKLKKYNENKYVSSFIGFASADHPSVVIAVVMDEPQGGARDGGQVSAPVFKEIAEQILPELNVVPDGNLRRDSLNNEAQISTETETIAAKKIDKKSAETKKPEETKKNEDKKSAPTKQTAARMQKPNSETKNKSSGTTKK